MQKIDQANIKDILSLLSDRISLVFPNTVWRFVVCGGAALNALNLVTRTTKDVDVIGKLVKNELRFAELDDLFREQIVLCAEQFDLPHNWFNTMAESYIKTGLPSGLLQRLTWICYGQNLHIGFISRIDQIFFKLYAGVDRGGYHVDDLISLSPTESELVDACRWVCEQDPSEGFRHLLVSMLEQLGFNHVAGKI
jgi:hypothetical protein